MGRSPLTPYLLLTMLVLLLGPGIGLGAPVGSVLASSAVMVSASVDAGAGNVRRELRFLPQPSFQFVSARLGWLVESPDQNRIMRTVDGGRTWRTSYVAQAPPGAAEGLVTNVQFVNQRNGLALANRAELIVTHNGGRSWSSLYRSALLSFDFTSTRDGWALTSGGGLLKSVNGGRSWEAVSSPIGATLCVTKPGHVWLGGVDGNVYVATAGGSWSSSLLGSSVPNLQSSVGPPPAVPPPSLFCTATSVWALYSWGEAAGSTAYVLERTLDGGRDWAAVLSAQVSPAVDRTPRGAGGTLVDLAAEGPSTAWFLTYCGPCTTGDPTITSTTDGTDFTATSLPLPHKTYGIPLSMTFLNPTVGWLVMQEQHVYSLGVSTHAHFTEVVLNTRDGGHRWTVEDQDLVTGP